MTRVRYVVSEAFLWGLSLVFLTAQEKVEPPSAEPQALYIFPVGGQRGSTVEVTIDGQTLADTYAVWTDCDELQASVMRIVEIDRQIWEKDYAPKKQLTHEVTLKVKISRAAELGGHSLRLISPRGISNPMPFRVTSLLEPLILEDESQAGSNKPIKGQAVEYPVAINGRIGRTLGGEVDYYSFDVDAGRELCFEVFFPSLGGKMLLYLYKPSASWVDPHRLVRLAFNDDPISHERVDNGTVVTPEDLVVRARLKHRFAKPGRYLIAVKAFDDKGGPGFVYQLRIAPTPLNQVVKSNRAWPLAHPRSVEWMERRFHRHLSTTRLQELSWRTVLVPPEEPEMEGKAGSGVAGDAGDGTYADRAAQELDPLEAVTIYPSDQGPHGSPDGIPVVDLPAILEGSIDHPGKTDHFRFRAEPGETLAFELETPQAKVPIFNPWVRILDQKQELVFSCIFNRVEGNNVQLFRYFEPKMVYTFRQGGEYTVEIRDLTTRYAGPEFQYRVMIRPQVPHIGGLELDVDRVNLLQGKAKRLTVTADREEGFGGEIALSVENLPAGVQAYPTAVQDPYRPPAFDEGEKDVFRPETQKVSLTLIAEERASPTRVPVFVLVKARAVVDGVPGAEIEVGKFPLMIVPPPDQGRTPLTRIDHRFGNEGDFGRPERFSESFAIDPVQVE